MDGTQPTSPYAQPQPGFPDGGYGEPYGSPPEPLVDAEFAEDDGADGPGSGAEDDGAEVLSDLTRPG